jgi:branched-chain amino acid transport system ATP-binding protein
MDGQPTTLLQYNVAVTAPTDRNVILVKGRVVFAGTGSEIKARPELLQQHLGI